MNDPQIPASIVIAVLGLLGGVMATQWTRLSGVRSECLKAVSEARTEAAAADKELRATTDQSLNRLHTRVDDLQAAMVSKDDLLPIRDDMRQIRDQINVLSSDLHKFMAAARVAAE